MAQIPKGRLVKGAYKPICRDCAIYVAISVIGGKTFPSPSRLFITIHARVSHWCFHSSDPHNFFGCVMKKKSPEKKNISETTGSRHFDKAVGFK